MSKVLVEINSNNYASTGNVMFGIANEARKNDFIVYTCCKKSRFSLKIKHQNQIYIGLILERKLSEMLAYITGLKNHFNIIGTLLFIHKLKKIKPDIIQLHSLVDTFINTNLLFKYFSKIDTPIIWTFHDPWAFTGQCIMYDDINCHKWINGCNNCPIHNRYPTSLVDNTAKLWKEKNIIFNNLNNFSIITPSKWLCKEINTSFLNKYNVNVINNAINLTVFNPKNGTFRKKFNYQNKYIILGVAYKWIECKGINTFIELANDLPEKYKIVLIGKTDDKINIPSNIHIINQTYNKNELVELYSCADLFVNPTTADNFPTVNLEAIACGTPVLTYDSGGSSEMITDKCGSIVKKNDYEQLLKETIRICETNPYKKEDCINQAKNYDSSTKYIEYINIYNQILNQ